MLKHHWFYTVSGALLWFLTPLSTLAHEVYVLDAETIEALKNTPRTSFIDVLSSNVSDTLLWGTLVGFIIITVFILSISPRLENKYDGFLVKIKHFAPVIARVTLGLAFLFCAYHQSLFGPELPFTMLFGEFSNWAALVFWALGVFILFGFFPRICGIIGLGFFTYAVFNQGLYMVTYFNYLAELLVLIMIGGHKFSVAEEHHVVKKSTSFFDYISSEHGEFAFLILRIGFGISLIYASVYAKIFHNQMALAVVHEFDLVSVFGFNPEFIVFGAAIIEILLGVFFILGIEVRFTAIVMNIFLTLSLLYFGEAVWPHIILIGVPIAFFFYGYDKYSLEGYFFKKGNREPIF